MKKMSICIGLLLLMHNVPKVHAGLYDDVYGFMLHSTMLNEVELMVEKFIPKALNKEVVRLQQKHIDFAITENYSQLCNPDNNDGKFIQYDQCVTLKNTIIELAKRESLIRTLGRDLQTIALSYESGASGYTGEKESAIYRDMYEIGKIWESGIDRMTNPIKQPPIRKVLFEDEDKAEEIADDLQTEFQKLFEGAGSSKSELYNRKLYHKYVGAGWRYRHGVFYVQNREGSCTKDGEGDETELEYIKVRWCEIEKLLKKARNELASGGFDPPLEPEEIAIFPTQSIGTDLYLWIRNDDAGVMWKNPMRPILPGLITSAGSVSEGGDYPIHPREPGEDEGICSHSFGARGYLCRPIEADRCISNDAEDFDADGDEILLTGCEPQNFNTFVRMTESGPDLCKVGGWRTPVRQDGDQNLVKDTPNKDPKMRPGKCTNCAIDMHCGNCGSGAGITRTKNDKGVIEICIEDDGIAAPKYIIMHELIHAQQLCDLPPGSARPGGCCSREYSAHIISCKAMTDDGILDGSGIGVEECASILSNLSCGNWKNACTKVDVEQEVFDKLKEFIKPEEDGATCAQEINALDPRSASIKESSKKTCDTNCRVEYDNTIGNNLCYIGQCVEESLENNRIIPGRITLGAQDEAYPWDACTKKDPQLGRLLELPPLSRTFLPAYRGQHIIQQIDILLCQGNALPRLTPPILCSFDPRRRTTLPVRFFYQMGTSLLNQQGEQQARSDALHLSIENISARVGQQLYNYYMRKALREFTDIIRAANMLTRQLGELDIPDSVCPRFYNGSCRGL